MINRTTQISWMIDVDENRNWFGHGKHIKIDKTLYHNQAPVKAPLP